MPLLLFKWLLQPKRTKGMVLIDAISPVALDGYPRARIVANTQILTVDNNRLIVKEGHDRGIVAIRRVKGVNLPKEDGARFRRRTLTWPHCQHSIKNRCYAEYGQCSENDPSATTSALDHDCLLKWWWRLQAAALLSRQHPLNLKTPWLKENTANTRINMLPRRYQYNSAFVYRQGVSS